MRFSLMKIEEGQPFSFIAGKGQVIKGKLIKGLSFYERLATTCCSDYRNCKCFLGWDLGILGGLEGEIPPMNVGGVRELGIPAGLAYGSNEVGPIPANQDLEFKIQVLRAEKETDISLEFRVGGIAAALGIPAFILLVVYYFFVF